MIDNDFARRRRALDQSKSAIPRAPRAVYRADLTKGPERHRLYRIDPIATGWRCEVWAGATIHRTHDVSTRTQMTNLKRQFAFEVGELLKDGWTLE